jgi:hypothetical protein
MADAAPPSGPDLALGIADAELRENVPLLGHGPATLSPCAQRRIHALGATCTHHGRRSRRASSPAARSAARGITHVTTSRPAARTVPRSRPSPLRRQAENAASASAPQHADGEEAAKTGAS